MPPPRYLKTFEGTRVLVTGHSGFKGSWLALWLQTLGAEVYGFSLPPEPGSLFELANVGRHMRSVWGDVRDLIAVRRVFAETNPEIVFHLAAQSLVRRSYAQPVDTYSTNVMGTVHVLEAARAASGLRAVVVVTSDKCYENIEADKSYTESDPLGGADPYSSSKSCAELVTSAYRRSFLSGSQSPLVATGRAGNVIGGGDWAEDRIVPDIARAIAAHKPVVVRNPDSVRPWQHVLEPLRGYLMLAARLAAGQRDLAGPWNFGPGEAGVVSVKDLAQRFVKAWGQGAIEVRHDGKAPPEAGLLRLDISKARSVLGYEPVFDLDMTVDWSVAWYRGNLEHPKQARQTTEEQLSSYMRMLSGAVSAGQENS